MAAALEMILKNDKLVLLTEWLNAKLIKEPCKYELITDETFPKKPYGFFYSNSSPEWFELDEIDVEILSKFMEHFMAIYLSPHHCYTTPIMRGISINQLQTLFYMVLTGAGAAMVGVGIEHVYTATSNIRSKSKKSISNHLDIWLAKFP